MLAGSVPLPMEHLDALTVRLLDITGEVPFYAATVARARLSRLQQRLATALTNPVSDVLLSIDTVCCVCFQMLYMEAQLRFSCTLCIYLSHAH